MGQRGPQTAPAEAKRLAGKPSQPVDDSQPAGIAGVPVRPKLRDEVAEEAWDILCETLSDMEVLATSYQTIMELFCQTKSMWVESLRALELGGHVLAGAKGGNYVNPWANLETMYAKRMESYLVAMGLSPASRAGVTKVPSIETKEGKSRFFSDGLKVVG